MNALALLPSVVSFDDHSDQFIRRLHLHLANGYTASVVQGLGSYGGDRGLFEIAVLHDGELIYDTPVTDDVIGYLHSEQVPEIVEQIAALPPRTASH